MLLHIKKIVTIPIKIVLLISLSYYLQIHGKETFTKRKKMICQIRLVRLGWW